MGPAPDVPVRGISARSVLLGLVLTVVHTCWVIYEELALLHIGAPTLFTLVQTVIGILFALLVTNSLLLRVRPQWVLSPAELIVIFVMTTFGAIVSASKLLHYLFPTLLWPTYQPGLSGGAATAGYLPAFFAPQNPGLVRDFFLGKQTFWAFFRPEILLPWLPAMAFWGIFLFLLLWTMLCLSSLVRRQWIDQERIPFPIIELPLMMARANNAGTLFANRGMLLGFGITCVLLSVNYLSSLYPSIPGLKMAEYDIGAQMFVSSPWSSVNPLLTVWWPYAIGLCYLIPLDVSFSCWFFFLFIRLLVVLATAMGWRDPGSAQNTAQFPYFGNLAEGAWLGMFAVMAWNSRALPRQLWNAFRGRGKIPGEETEAIPYRMALLGAILGFAALVGIGIAAGMRPQVALLAFALYFIAIVVMTRMYAQVSLPMFCMAFFSFTSWTTTFTGTLGLTRPEGATLSSFYWFDRTYEQLPMGHHLESLVLADRLKQSKRRMVGVILLASVVGIVVGMFTLLQIFYDRGAATAQVGTDPVWLAGAAWARYTSWMDSPKPVEMAVLLRTAFSAGVVVLLTVARNAWFGFPLHPIGYLFASSFALEWGMWNVIFVTWLVKALVVRYGGLRAYRGSVPFFLGLALGDAVTHFVWGIGLGVIGARGASPY